MPLAVVIVTYNSAGHIADCLASLLPWLGRVVSEVVVVDNASSDSTRAQAAQYGFVRMIANSSNLGFAAAVNQGVRTTTGQAILLLNPDSTILAGLDRISARLEDPQVGAVGGRLEDSSGRPQSGFQARRFPTALSLSFEVLGLNRIWPGNPVNRRYRYFDLDPDRPAEVDQPAGACIAFRREAFEAISGFDESFFPLWFEDVDFCLRLRRAGWTIRYEPEARARHAGAHSVTHLAWGSRQRFWYGSLLRYVARHMGIGGRLLVCGSVGVAAGPRAVAGIAGQRTFQPVIVFGRVVCLAVACLFGYSLDGMGTDQPAKDRH